MTRWKSPESTPPAPPPAAPEPTAVTPPQVTEATSNHYRRVARQYSERARLEGRAPQTGNLIVDGANALAEGASHIFRATFRAYRAAFLHVLAEDPSPESLAAIERLRAIKPGEAGSDRRLPRRAKQLPKCDMDRIIEALIKRRSAMGSLLAAWLMAGRLTGLRPTEWATASWKDYDHDTGIGPLLIVQNHKTPNGRSHGPTRTLDLSLLAHTDQQIVMRLVDAVKAIMSTPGADGTGEAAFDKAYENCSRLLRRVSRMLWPRRIRQYSLYSARHAFSANAMATCDKIQVAALMGHKNVRTAQIHYGRRAVAGQPEDRGPIPVPVPADDVASIVARESAHDSGRLARVGGNGTVSGLRAEGLRYLARGPTVGG